MIGFAIGTLLMVAFGVWAWSEWRGSDPPEAPRAAVNTVNTEARATEIGTEVASQAAVTTASGGLGLTEAEWQAIHGEPVRTQFDDVLDRYPGPDGADVNVRHAMNDTGRMTYLEITFDTPLPLDDAERIVAEYLPQDARVVDEYRHDLANRPVVLYHSAWLAEVGPPSDSAWWFNAEPGSFAVMYGWPANNRPSGPVATATISLGHSP